MKWARGGFYFIVANRATNVRTFRSHSVGLHILAEVDWDEAREEVDMRNGGVGNEMYIAFWFEVDGVCGLRFWPLVRYGGFTGYWINANLLMECNVCRKSWRS